MCTSSIHVPHRLAGKSERLVVRQVSHYKGFYPRSGSDQRLVCLRGQKEITIKQVLIDPAFAAFVQNQWVGKKNVKVMFRGYSDLITFPDATVMQLAYLKPGVQVDYEAPARKRILTGKPGMKAVEASIKEALATTPDERAPKVRTVKA